MLFICFTTSPPARTSSQRTSLSPSFATLSSLPLPPVPLFFPQFSELGVWHRSEGRDGCANLLHSWHGSHQKLVASILSQTPQFLFSWMPINFSGKEKVFFSLGIRFQTQRQIDSAQCRKLSIGFYIFCVCDCRIFRGSVSKHRGTHIFLKALGSHPLNLSGLQDPV